VPITDPVNRDSRPHLLRVAGVAVVSFGCGVMSGLLVSNVRHGEMTLSQAVAAATVVVVICLIPIAILRFGLVDSARRQ